MKNVFRSFKSLPRRLIVGAGVALAALMLPLSTLSAANVRLEGSLGIANVTAGDTQYKESVSASYDQVLKVQVYYHNMENPDSGKIANDLRLKLNVPTTPGQKQTITGTISSPDTNTVTDSVVANLDRADANLEYIPGSAVWKHNKGTNENVQIVEEKISDEVVYGAQGLVLEDAKPCFNFDATVTILVRVRVPGIKINKQVRVKGTTEWKAENTAKPGETVEYLITYQNAGNTTHKAVEIRDNLPPSLTYIPGSAKLINNEWNEQTKKWETVTKPLSNAVVTTGTKIGDYLPGSGAYVTLEAKVPAADKLQCGKKLFRNVAVAQPSGMNEFYNTASTIVEKVCEENPEEPSYVCESVKVEKLGGRKIQVTIKAPASDGAVFKQAIINFGDGTTPKTTDQLVSEYTYTRDGNFTVTAEIVFTVDGKDQAPVSSDACADTVKFETPETPGELPKTGAGSTIGLFVIVTLGFAAAHNLLSRRIRA